MTARIPRYSSGPGSRDGVFRVTPESVAIEADAVERRPIGRSKLRGQVRNSTVPCGVRTLSHVAQIQRLSVAADDHSSEPRQRLAGQTGMFPQQLLGSATGLGQTIGIA